MHLELSVAPTKPHGSIVNCLIKGGSRAGMNVN